MARAAHRHRRGRGPAARGRRRRQARETLRGETALMRAAGEKHAAVVTRLARRKADLDVRSKHLEYPNIREDFSTMVFTAIPRAGSPR
jgi:hypothetical protein